MCHERKEIVKSSFPFGRKQNKFLGTQLRFNFFCKHKKRKQRLIISLEVWSRSLKSLYVAREKFFTHSFGSLRGIWVAEDVSDWRKRKIIQSEYPVGGRYFCKNLDFSSIKHYFFTVKKIAFGKRTREILKFLLFSRRFWILSREVGQVT